MADLGWKRRLLGRTLVRSSLLKPLDLILDQLERYPGERPDRLRAAVADEIFAYLDRVRESDRRPGRAALEAIRAYVGHFFDDLLAGEHHGDVNRLLSRARLIRSAYHQYIREAVPARLQQAAEATPEAPIHDLVEPNEIQEGA
jgi:hypothetical protein